MKDINEWFEAEDFLALMANKSDKSGAMTEQIVYYDGHILKQFFVDHQGSFINEKRGIGSATHQQIFVLDGSTKTFAEQVDSGGHANVLVPSAWQLFGKWYVKKFAHKISAPAH